MVLELSLSLQLNLKCYGRFGCALGRESSVYTNCKTEKSKSSMERHL